MAELSEQHLSDIGQRLDSAISGQVMLDFASRGRYATDASVYQMMPFGVVVPELDRRRRRDDADRARRRCTCIASRRWHLAMRTDRQPRARH